MRQALFFSSSDQGVRCFLCRQNCLIKQGCLGACRVRQNLKNKLVSLNYGKLVARNIDPIEKKPLYHFLPGSFTYSIASLGCNFKCGFCQNWQISQGPFEAAGRVEDVSAGEVVLAAKKAGCASISYTYTEPTVFFEFALDVAKQAQKAGLYNNFVTNGYMSRAALKEISPFLDACNVDLKSFSQKFYRSQCKACLDGVLDSITYMKELGIWIEITTLIIPDLNDSAPELTQIARFIAGLDKDIPWHISRFYPHYQIKNTSPTPVKTLELAYQIGKDSGLSYIYIGNLDSKVGQDTQCPECKDTLIRREGFRVIENKVGNQGCLGCGRAIAGFF